MACLSHTSKHILRRPWEFLHAWDGVHLKSRMKRFDFNGQMAFRIMISQKHLGRISSRWRAVLKRDRHQGFQSVVQSKLILFVIPSHYWSSSKQQWNNPQLAASVSIQPPGNDSQQSAFFCSSHISRPSPLLMLWASTDGWNQPGLVELLIYAK